MSKITTLSRKTIRTIKNTFTDFSGRADWPGVIFISINSVCNARCKMCDVGQQVEDSQFFKNLRINSQKPVELKLSRLKKLVEEVRHFKPLISVISTEPLLYKDLFKFAKYVRRNGLDIAVTTNGILLKKYARDFVESEVTNLWVSLDGPAHIHNYIRGVPQIFQKATAGIKEIEKWKKTLGKDNPKLNINFTISNFNYDKIVEFIESIIPLKPATVSVSHYNYVTLEVAKEHNEQYGNICRATPSCISAVDLKKIKPKVLLKQLKEAKKKYAARVNMGFAPDLTTEKQIFDFYNNPHVIVTQPTCRAPWQIAQILADGSLTISTRCFNMELGNINKTNFKDAWNSPEFCKFRKIIKKHGLFVPACTRCCAVL